MGAVLYETFDGTDGNMVTEILAWKLRRFSKSSWVIMIWI